jgi:predicted PurR-regulated permease PerM
MGWRSRDILRTAGILVAVYALTKLIWFAHPLILTAFLGVLFGLAVTSGVDRLSAVRIGRFHLPRGVASALIVFGAIGLLVGVGAWTAPVLRKQSAELKTKLPQALDKAEAWAQAHRGGLIGMMLPDEDSTATPKPAAGLAPKPVAPTPPAVERTARADSASAGAAAAGPDSAATRATAPKAKSSRLRDQIGEQLGGAKRYLFPFVSSTFAAIGGLLIVIFLTIYISADPGLYHDGLMHLFPHRARDRAGEVLSAIATALRKWLTTQVIAMLAIGSVTMVTLLLLGVKAAIPLGIIAGLLEFVPTVGPILSAVPAIAMGFVDSPEKALYVGIAYVGIQFLENHLLIPLLMKRGVDLPPAITILAQALMAIVFGFLGLLVAVPLLAAAKVAIQMLYVEDVVGDDVEVPSDPLDTAAAR